LEIIPDSDEGGFVGSYPDLPGCLTCGETMEEEGIVTTAAARGKHLVAVVSNTLRSSSNHKSFDNTAFFLDTTHDTSYNKSGRDDLMSEWEKLLQRILSLSNQAFS